MFIVAVGVVGFIISLINRLFYKCVNGNRVVCYATGIIGTPIHELSHALLCLVFFHKITEIRLFQIDERTGVLGYVNHSYNRKNIYQVAGNYFIGIAPIVCGSAVLYLLMMLLLPDAFQAAQTNFDTILLVVNSQRYSYILSALYEMVIGIYKGIFSQSFADWRLWVFLIICFCIALHMNLSGADIKGSLTALPIMIVLIAVFNLIFGYTDMYGSYLGVVTSAGCVLVGFLLLSVIFSLMLLVVGLIVFLLRKLIGRR